MPLAKLDGIEFISLHLASSVLSVVCIKMIEKPNFQDVRTIFKLISSHLKFGNLSINKLSTCEVDLNGSKDRLVVLKGS